MLQKTYKHGTKGTNSVDIDSRAKERESMQKKAKGKHSKNLSPPVRRIPKGATPD